MIVSLGLQNYRNSGQMLEAYKSNRGTSCVEVLHSVMDKTMYIFNRIRQMVDVEDYSLQPSTAPRHGEAVHR